MARLHVPVRGPWGSACHGAPASSAHRPAHRGLVRVPSAAETQAPHPRDGLVLWPVWSSLRPLSPLGPLCSDCDFGGSKRVSPSVRARCAGSAWLSPAEGVPDPCRPALVVPCGAPSAVASVPCVSSSSNCAAGCSGSTLTLAVSVCVPRSHFPPPCSGF